jgi:hypothetical protein
LTFFEDAMLFFNGKEDMGLEASLKLLDLPPDATIDDANQAYAYLHSMVDVFHQDDGAGNRGGRREDMELLTCAYEKAVAYLSDRHPRKAPSAAIAPSRRSGVDGPESTDLHFTINFNADTTGDTPPETAPADAESTVQPVEEAISITTRRMRQTESALPGAQKAVESATAAVASAHRRYELLKQERLAVIVAAKSAKSRALLLEIEAKRAMADAIALAEKARDRVVAARQAARDAMADAGSAREKVGRIRKSEETAAAEMVCAEDRLEKEKARLKGLTHTLVETRNWMAVFRETAEAAERQQPEACTRAGAAIPDNRSASPPVDGEADARRKIMSDLLEIEASLDARKRAPVPIDGSGDYLSAADGPEAERRRTPRLVYPVDRRPVLSMDGRSIPILNLSPDGICLEPDSYMPHPRIVRGEIAFGGRRAMPITGKVVRADDHGLGLRLVTRIGRHILDQERLRLNA